MQYRTDKKSGNSLSVLGFGCMRFPPDLAKTERLILKAVEKGVNYYDTAYIYGNSESVLGGIIQRNNLRDKIYIATKLPHYKCKAYEDFDRLLEIQLRRLKTDYIDYYLIHNMSKAEQWVFLKEMGIEKWINEKKEQGKIKQIGFSFHGSQDEFLELIDAYNWDFCQIQYNYMDENYQAGKTGLAKAHEKGLSVIIMEPLLGGKLATGLPEKALSLFKDIVPQRSAASWALSWLWNQEAVTVVLSGMNAFDQLDDNVQTAESAQVGFLKDKESAVFEPVIAALREGYKIPCTGCNYCMPCPHGVNIPGCFSAYNTSFVMGHFAGLTQYITGAAMTKKAGNGSAGNCKKCGLCEKKCPQNIPIIASLPSVAGRMEPLWFRVIMKAVRIFIG